MLGSLLAHRVGRQVRDVEEDAAARRAAALGHLGVDRARDDVAGRELHPLGVVALHEALAVRVAEHAALAAHGLGHQQARDARRPDHPGRVELDELHVDELRARLVGERVAVAGALPRVRGDLVAAAGAAGREHERPRAEERRARRSRASSRTRPQTRSPSFSRCVIVHSMKTSTSWCTALSCSVRISSRPVRSPMCTSRRCVWPPNARCDMWPDGVRSKTPPHCSSSRTRSGASFACSSAMRQLFRYLPPTSCPGSAPSTRRPRRRCRAPRRSPPSAITVCALPSSDLQTSAVRAPSADDSIAARMPAPPAPMTTTSWSCVSSSGTQMIRGSSKTPYAASRT